MLAAGIRGTRFLAIGESKAKTELRTAGRGPDSESVPARAYIANYICYNEFKYSCLYFWNWASVSAKLWAQEPSGFRT